MNVTEHTAYQSARKLSQVVWNVSRGWDKMTQRTLGSQLIRSSDSISANLAEGWSRDSKKDKCNFYVIARASVSETKDWIEKAYERDLLDKDSYMKIESILTNLPRDINGLIKGTKQNLQN